MRVRRLRMHAVLILRLCFSKKCLRVEGSILNPAKSRQALHLLFHRTLLVLKYDYRVYILFSKCSTSFKFYYIKKTDIGVIMKMKL